MVLVFEVPSSSSRFVQRSAEVHFASASEAELLTFNYFVCIAIYLKEEKKRKKIKKMKMLHQPTTLLSVIRCTLNQFCQS